MASREETAAFLQGKIDQLTSTNEKKDVELAEVRSQMQALIQEFTDATDEETPEKIRKNIRGRIAQSLVVLDELLATGKEATRASIAKFFVQQGLLPTSSEETTSELNKLLVKLGVDDQ